MSNVKQVFEAACSLCAQDDGRFGVILEIAGLADESLAQEISTMLQDFIAEKISAHVLHRANNPTPQGETLQ